MGISGGDGASEPGHTQYSVRETVALEPDLTTTLRFATAIMAGGAVVELRALRAQTKNGYVLPANFNGTVCGWYDRPDHLTADAARVRGVSIYTTFNPCDRDLLARSYNSLAKSNCATKDEDILCLRWLYVDIDPVRKADISATDAERSLALGRRDAILAAVPGLAESCLSGSSGNGAYILARIPDLGNDEVGRKTVADALRILATQHDDAAVKVDPTTKNPARVMAVGGSIKAKGSNIPERPWRVVTLDCVPADGAIFDIAGFVAAHADLLPSDASRGSGSRRPAVAVGGTGGTLGTFLDPGEMGQRIFRATRYLNNVAPAVSGQNGHGQAFDAACSLIKGFDLPIAHARPILAEWSQRCLPPWSDYELDHKLAQADEKPDDKPRGYLFATSKPDGATIASQGNSGEAADSPYKIGWEDNPHDIAREFMSEHHSHPDGSTIRFLRGEPYNWDGTAYHRLEKTELQANANRHTAQRFEQIYYRQLKEYAQSSGDGKKRPRPIPVTRALVSNVLDALASLPGVTLSAAQYRDATFWINGEGKGPPADYLPMRNAIVRLPSYFGGQACTQRPTPAFFNLHSLEYDWNPNAPPPTRWLRFLDEVFPGDRQSVEFLQEWMGLQLVPDVEFQKAACFLGESRAGKGTVVDVMKSMIGSANFAALTLSSFGETFGLESLIGKLAVIIDDARVSARHDHATIAGRLLSITGAGNLAIPRKFRPSFDGVLTARLTILSNELPKIEDAAGVLPKRFVILRFSQSFAGREDLALKDSLKQELPGILIWSLEGLRRLKERGRFAPPTSGLEMHDEMKAASLAAKEFVEDYCVVGPGRQCDRDAMFTAWTAWSERVGRKGPGSAERMVREIRAVAPDVKAYRRMVGGRIVRVLFGIDLLPPSGLVNPSSPF